MAVKKGVSRVSTRTPRVFITISKHITLLVNRTWVAVGWEGMLVMWVIWSHRARHLCSGPWELVLPLEVIYMVSDLYHDIWLPPREMKSVWHGILPLDPRSGSIWVIYTIDCSCSFWLTHSPWTTHKWKVGHALFAWYQATVCNPAP
jgi:hypothetical protein